MFWLEDWFDTAIYAWEVVNIHSNNCMLIEYYDQLENSIHLVNKDWGDAFDDVRYVFRKKFGFSINKSTLVAVFMTVMYQHCTI